MFALGHRGLCATLIANMMLWGHFKKRHFMLSSWIIYRYYPLTRVFRAVQAIKRNNGPQTTLQEISLKFMGSWKWVFVVRAAFWSHWITQQWNVNLDHAFVKVEKNLAIDSVILITGSSNNDRWTFLYFRNRSKVQSHYQYNGNSTSITQHSFRRSTVTTDFVALTCTLQG